MLAISSLRRGLAKLAITWLAVLALPAAAQNVIQRENAKTAGVTGAWFISDASYANNQEIEGYASATSVNRGGSINLFVQTKTSDPTYTINIYRVGWYGGTGGRLVHGPVTRSRTAQPACPMTDSATRLVECNWVDPYVLNIPNNTSDATDWASGIYLAKLTGNSTGRQSYIIFVVRDDARSARAMFQASVTTYAAYNHWGGYNFYDSDSLGAYPAHKLSFDRPYKNPQRHLNGKGAGEFLSWEINMLRFMEREGYDVKYSTNIDTHTSPARLLEQRLFLSVGHDEYYTRPMYDALEAARNAGVNLAFIGANAIYWQVRLEANSLTGQAHRTVVGYKYYADPMASVTPSLTTYLWREPPLNRPEAALIGVMYDYNTVDLDMIMSNCPSWVCAGANAAPGTVLPGMLGYEVDRIAPSSPAGISIIASSPYVVNGETRYSQVTYYTAASGAGVFATGSMQWTWGLDSFTPGASEHGDRSNAAVQQITRNVLNRFTDVGNAAPVISTTAITTATANSAYSYDVNATDANGDALTYALTQAPSGMSINAGNGLIGWLPTGAQVGAHPVTVRVSDPGGLFATQQFTINVSAGGPVAPQITTSAVTTAAAGSPYSYDVNATDGNGDALTYALTTAPAGMSINAANGLIAWTPTTAQVGSHAVTVRVSDPGSLFATQSFTLVVSSAVAPSTTRVDASTPPSYAAAPGGTVAITLNWYRIRMATDYLQFMHLVNATGQVWSVDDHWTTSGSWTNGPFTQVRSIALPASIPLGTYDIRVGLSGGSPWVDLALVAGSGVTDPDGTRRYKVGTLTVGTGNVAPQITTSPVTTASPGAAYSYDVNASDANGDALTYSLTTAPSGMSINAGNGLIMWAPTTAQAGNQAVTVRVADPGGLFATQSFTIVVSSGNVAPQITTTAVTTAAVGTAYSYDVNATDANGDTLTYSLTTAPSGMSINAANGLIAWTPAAAQAGNQAVTVRVADPGGLFASQSFTIVVSGGNVAPQITTTAVTTARVGTAYSYDVNATDANGDTLTYSLTTAPSGMSINAANGLIAWTPTAAQVGNRAITVRVADPGGLAATQSFTIVVTAANTAPQITSTAVTTASVGAAYSYDVNATDANGDTLAYALSTAPSGMSINAANGLIAWTPTAAQTGSQAVTVRVSDPGGLAATQSFSISVTAGGPAPATTRADLATPSSYTANAGTSVAITLNWYRIRMATDYLQFMHLVNAAGQVWSVDDHWTTSGSWTNGLFTQTRTVALPAGMPAGTYDIRVGLSGGSPWVDLPLVAGSGVTDPDGSRRYKVGTLTVR